MKFILSFVLLLSFFAFNCKSPTAPSKNNPSPDTTSNSFTWKDYTFGGQGGSSYFKDVAIVNDSDIWAVGEIYTSQDSIYNAVHWNGKKWALLQVPYYYQGQPYYHPIISVFSFGANDLSFCGNGIIHWDGRQYNPIPIPTNVWGPYQMNKIYGINNSDFYICGDSGNIAHYQSGIWTKMESGTKINLRDIWGSSDGKTVWACGYSNDYGSSILLKYDGNSWTPIWSRQPSSNAPPYQYFISSLWASDNYLYVAADVGIFRTALQGNDSTEEVLQLSSGPHSIRGSADNNIAIALDDGSIWHYNGAGWFKATNSVQLNPLYSISVSSNTIVAVGFDATNILTKGLIVFGKRN